MNLEFIDAVVKAKFMIDGTIYIMYFKKRSNGKFAVHGWGENSYSFGTEEQTEKILTEMERLMNKEFNSAVEIQ